MAHAKFRVIYLTGAPAAGKSTLTRGLASVVTPLEIFEYGEMLTRHIAERSVQPINQDGLRQHSSTVVRPEDVQAVDRLLLDSVTKARERAHVVIDSHAVTKERYGFRIIPYSFERFGLLSPDAICVLFTTPEVTIDRIANQAAGRPRVTIWESGFHTGLQAAVGAAYGMSLGIPIYLVDSSSSLESIVSSVERLFRSPSEKPSNSR